MKKILPFLTLLLVGCSSFDEVKIQESPILASATTEEMTTRATLIENTTTLADVFPTMTIQTGSTKLDVATSDLVKGNYKTGFYWTGSAKTFVSYPKGVINPTVGDGTMSFEYAPSTSMDDIVVAIDKKNNAPIEFKYRHIFCTVNVIYESVQTAHKVTNISVSGEVAGKCTVTPTDITWSASSAGEGHNYFYNPCNVYKNGQELTVEKYMLVPLSAPVVRFKIDGSQEVTKTINVDAVAPGNIINFTIKDSCTFVDVVEARVNGEQSFKKADDNTYSMSLTPFLSGTVKDTTITDPSHTILVLDCSGSMKEYMYSAPLAYHSYFFGSKDKNFDKLDVNNPSKYVCYVGGEAGDGVSRDVDYVNGHWKYFNKTDNKWHTINGEGGTLYTVYVYDRNKVVTAKKKIDLLKEACISYVERMSQMNNTSLVSVVRFSGHLNHSICERVDVTKNKNTVIDAINELSAYGYTPADEGMKSAKSILSKTKGSYYNSVIFITDGEPGLGLDFNERVANLAVSYSNDCKNSYSAKVYSIGMFEEDAVSSNCDAFLDRISSNYKGATKYNGGSKVDSKYYSLVTSTDAFTTILSDIATSVKYSVADIVGVDSTAELRFIFSDLFDISSATFSSTTTCSYNSNWKSTGSLVITGFDYQSLNKADFKVSGLKLKDSNFKGTACSFLPGSGLWCNGVCIEEFHDADFTL